MHPLNQLKAFLSRENFAHSVTILASGTALGQGLILLASPILTRIYTPEDFGVLAVFVFVLSMVVVVASLRYELAIPLPEDDQTAINLLALAFGLVIVMSLLAGSGVLLFGHQLVTWINAPALTPYLWLLPLGTFGAGLYQVFNYWAVRKKAFNRIANTKLNQSVGLILTHLGIGFLYSGAIGLLFGQIVSQVAGTTTLARIAWREDRGALTGVNLQDIGKAAWRYKQFPLFSSWSAIFNTLSVHIPILMLSYFFDSKIMGLYTLANRVLQTPISLIGKAVTQVFFSKVAEANREGILSSSASNIFGKLLQISLPLMLLGGIAAPEVFTYVFGNEWRQAGIYAQWLSPWLLLVFISSPLSILPSVLEKQGQELLFQITLLTSRLIALSVGGWLVNPNLAIALFAITSAFCWFFFMMWNMSLSGNGFWKVQNYIWKELFNVLPFALPLIVVKNIFNNDLYVIVTLGISGMLILNRTVHRLTAKG